jgi:hypothetical protein
VVALHCRDEVCGDAPNTRLPGMSVQVSPAGAEGDTERETVPVKPLTAVTVIVELPMEPLDICGLGVTAPAAIV